MEQRPLIDQEPHSTQRQPTTTNHEANATISGMKYIPDYITEFQHHWLLEEIEKHEWLDDLKRRVQHYGYKYDYKARRVNQDMYIAELPEWLKRLSNKIHKDLRKNGIHIKIPDQVIVNEYVSGQGIAAHIDCKPCFEDTIVSLSLESGCIMEFINEDNKNNRIEVWLAPRSLVVLSGEARSNWLHGIRPRKSDDWKGKKYKRERRVSLTFRKVIIE